MALKVYEVDVFDHVGIEIISAAFIIETILIKTTLEVEICDTSTLIVFKPEFIRFAERRVAIGVWLELTK